MFYGRFQSILPPLMSMMDLSCLQHAQMSKSQDLVNFVLTNRRQTNRETTLPLAHARGVIMASTQTAKVYFILVILDYEVTSHSECPATQRQGEYSPRIQKRETLTKYLPTGRQSRGSCSLSLVPRRSEGRGERTFSLPSPPNAWVRG